MIVQNVKRTVKPTKPKHNIKKTYKQNQQTIQQIDNESKKSGHNISRITLAAPSQGPVPVRRPRPKLSPDSRARAQTGPKENDRPFQRPYQKEFSRTYL